MKSKNKNDVRRHVRSSAIADAVGVKPRTLYHWKKARPTLYAALVDWYVQVYMPGLTRYDVVIDFDDTEDKNKNRNKNRNKK